MTDDRTIIVHVITKLELGGAQQNTLDTCRRLDRTRFRPILLAGPQGYLDSDAARIPDLDFRIVADLVRPVSPRRDLRAIRVIRDHLRELERYRAPIIVHTHSSKAGIVGRLAARRAGVSNVIHTIHGFGHPAFEHRWKQRLAIRLERHVAKYTDRFVAVSHANLAEGRALGLFEQVPVRLIRSGFDLDPFRPSALSREEAKRRLGLDPARPAVGMIACLKRQKDPETFVRAAAKIRDRIPSAQFLIAGDGDRRSAVVAERHALGLDSALILLGWRQDVPQVLRALDVMALTSRWEGLPRTVIQAMTARVPVVATAVDGVLDVVRDGVTGLLTAPGDTEGIAAAVGRLLTDESLGIALTEAAAHVADGEFDVERMVRQLEDLYSELLDRRSTRTS